MLPPSVCNATGRSYDQLSIALFDQQQESFEDRVVITAARSALASGGVFEEQLEIVNDHQRMLLDSARDGR